MLFYVFVFIVFRFVFKKHLYKLLSHYNYSKLKNSLSRQVLSERQVILLVL